MLEFRYVKSRIGNNNLIVKSGCQSDQIEKILSFLQNDALRGQGIVSQIVQIAVQQQRILLRRTRIACRRQPAYVQILSHNRTGLFNRTYVKTARFTRLSVCLFSEYRFYDIARYFQTGILDGRYFVIDRILCGFIESKHKPIVFPDIEILHEKFFDR